MRIEEAFAAAGITQQGEPIAAAQFRAACPNCQAASTADSMTTDESGEQTNYACGMCGATVITVSPAPGLGGYRIGDWVVNAAGGMEILIPPRAS
jgi:hypothetical protein